MPVRLRTHHLLCMLTYAGKGYSAGFVANYDLVIRRLSAGEPIEIVTGPDEICGPMLDCGQCHCRDESVALRDRTAAVGLSQLLQHPLSPGSILRITGSEIDRMRQAFADGGIRAACDGCEWHGMCTGIAAEGFATCGLHPVQSTQV